MERHLSLLEFLADGRPVVSHQPWPRVQLDEAGWKRLVQQLALADWQLLGLWGESGEIHVALRDEESQDVAVASLTCPDRKYAALSPVRPSAQRLERMTHDLFGLTPVKAVDSRRWLDHGRWPHRAPLAAVPGAVPSAPDVYGFLPVEGESLHQIPVGPVHAGIIEPGHFRFTCAGETVVRLEERLGYVHKGIESLLAGKPVAEAARLVGRVSGDSTVAYQLAFARAVEAAIGIEAPPRAHWLRALMAEWERIHNHVGDFGAVCNDAAFAIMLAHCSEIRERILRANAACFGHRFCMDRILPGGVAADLSREGRQIQMQLLREVRLRFTKLVRLYDDTPSLLDRTVGTGEVHGTLAHRFGAGGFVGRASMQSVDARRSPGYAPYDDLDFEVPVHAEGDVHARLMVRAEEVAESLKLIEQILEGMPGGPLTVPVPTRAGEGMALVEGFRGEILVWVRVSQVGKVVRCHPRDPSWFQWPLLEAAIEGNIVADFPLCNKSFNCSYSGTDL